MKIWFIIVLVVVVAIGVAMYDSFNTQEPLYQTIIQPQGTPKLAIDVKSVGAANWIYITPSKSDANLSALGGDVTVKILRGTGGGIYRSQGYGPAGGLTYSFQGTGGDYRLEFTFAHPDKWPEELALRIVPSP